MDNQTLISVAALVFTNIALMISLFLWIRSEANSDRREGLDLIRAIQEEMKEFHGRLCAIEEKHKK